MGEASSFLADAQRPTRNPVIRDYAVKDELVLMAPLSHRAEGANRALALNGAGRMIWELCDGTRTDDEIVDALLERFDADRSALTGHVAELLDRLSTLGFLEDHRADAADTACMTFVIGIEDTPYFRWQTAIFLESFRGKLPPGWKTLVVVCNNGEAFSPELSEILSRYGTAVARGTNHGRSDRIDVGHDGGQCYAAVNRVEALRVAADFVGEHDLICLLDSDTFLFHGLNRDVLPTKCAMPRNWHIEGRPFFSTAKANQGHGVDLSKLLEAIGIEGDFKPGGVNVFVTGAVAKNPKYIADCFRFAHAVYLLGRAAGADNTWMAEMPCFALAMVANGIEFELLERPEFSVSSGSEESIPTGTIYHYYSDPGDRTDGLGGGAFRNSVWHKQAYRDRNFLKTAFEIQAASAETEHERYFFELARRAREYLDV